MLESDPTDEAVDSLGVNPVFETELVGEKSGV